MFADSAKIYIKSGKGGDGHVSFRRELFVPNGGPDGGDGGKGGDIIFEVDEGLNTLTDFRHIRKYAAQNGAEGGKCNQHGKNGEDLVIKVPEGTIIKDDETGKIIADMSGENRREVILKGGRGGKGNQHFATATMQVPKYAKTRCAGKRIMGPSGVKSNCGCRACTDSRMSENPPFLSRVTNARPKIANYHFTTLNPNLGVVDLDGSDGFVIADIPGLIEGASEGIGLGHEFLKHIERTKVIIHMVDAASVEGRDPVNDIRKINAELEAYNPELLKKPQVIAANKIDALYDGDSTYIDLIKEEFEPEGIAVYPISAVSGKGVRELLYAVNSLLKTMDSKPVVYEKEFDPNAYYDDPEDPFTVSVGENGEFLIEGPRIEKMLGYTNLESEKGFMFFQNFMKENGILEELERLGIEDGDTVKIYGHEFEYYK